MKRLIIVHPHNGESSYNCYISPDIDPQKFIADNLKDCGTIHIVGLTSEPPKSENDTSIPTARWVKYTDGSGEVCCTNCHRRLNGAVYGYPYTPCCGAKISAPPITDHEAIKLGIAIPIRNLYK